MPPPRPCLFTTEWRSTSYSTSAVSSDVADLGHALFRAAQRDWVALSDEIGCRRFLYDLDPTSTRRARNAAWRVAIDLAQHALPHPDAAPAMQSAETSSLRTGTGS